MKRQCLLITLFLMCAVSSFAADFKSEAPANCKYCNMDRTAFAHSRMLLTYADGSAGTCSITCVVTEMKENRKKVTSFQVGDYNTKKLIDAKSATWVIGGKQRGVMTPVAKWAFAGKKAAEAFIAINGGKLATFDEALKAAEKEHAGSGSPQKRQERKGHGEHTL